MADGFAWGDLSPELEGPGVAIRRHDFDDLAVCLIRLNAGVRTDPLIAGLPEDRCLEITKSDDYDGLMAHCRRAMAA